MSHEIEAKTVNGVAVYSFVYSAKLGPAWHKLGTEGNTQDRQDWRNRAGQTFKVVKRPLSFPNGQGVMVPDPQGRSILVREDNEHGMGNVTDVYKIFQTEELSEVSDRIAANAGTEPSASGTLYSGEKVFNSYSYFDSVEIGGLKHQPNLMSSTTFDGSGASLWWLSMICAVCQNTINAGLWNNKAIVKVRHNALVEEEKVSGQIAEIASGIATYKKIGDALAQVTLSRKQVNEFVRNMLDIPLTATADEISTRKVNMMHGIADDMVTSAKERRVNPDGDTLDAFTLWQTMTRNLTHTRSVRTSKLGNETAARFDSAHFGNGNAFAAKAIAQLMPMIKDKIAA